MSTIHLKIACALFAIAPVAAAAQESDAGPSSYVSLFGGRTARILGSSEIRTDFGLGIAWQKFEPQFKWRYGPSQLVTEAYYEHSNGEDLVYRGRTTDAVGGLWYARFRFGSHSLNLFSDLGVGIQLSSSETYDLGTRLNTSPMVGVGFAIRHGNQETLVGLRLLHLSNANLNSKNKGQNQILFYLGAKL